VRSTSADPSDGRKGTSSRSALAVDVAVGDLESAQVRRPHLTRIAEDLLGLEVRGLRLRLGAERAGDGPVDDLRAVAEDSGMSMPQPRRGSSTRCTRDRAADSRLEQAQTCVAELDGGVELGEKSSGSPRSWWSSRQV
jgi:hypothetical protein